MNLIFDNNIDMNIGKSKRLNITYSKRTVIDIIKLYVVAILFIIFGFFSIDSKLYAQRSKSYVNVKSFFTKNALKGYPGIFDTNLVNPKSLILETPTISSGLSTIGDENSSSSLSYIVLPYFNLEYGVNSSFFVGTNIATFAPFLYGGMGGSLKARTKVYENSNFIDVVTFYAGGGNANIGDDASLSFNYFIFSNNAALVLSSRSSLTISAQFWTASLFKTDDEISNNSDDAQYTIEFLSTFLALNYQYFLGQYLGLSAVAVCPFYVDFVYDTLKLRSFKQFFELGYEYSFVRLSADIKIGSSNVLSVGGAYTPSLLGISDNSFFVWAGYTHNFSLF